MAKIVKNLTLLSLSLLFIFILIPIAQAKKDQSREFSISFKHAKSSSQSSPQNNFNFSEQADSGTNTASIVVSHGSVSYTIFSDNNGNGYYRKTTYWFDVDSNRKVNYYVQFYLNNNEGYGWYTNDAYKSDVYTANGSGDEGIYMENLYWMGYKEATEGVKVELYYEDGTLVDTYGPDDNEELGHVKIESIEFDVKKNPFTTTPNPTPTPTPDDVAAKITGYVVNNEGDSIIGAKIVARKDGETIATVSSDENGEFVLENLEPAEYNLQVTKKGYRKKIVTVTIEEGGSDEKIVIELKKR